MDTNANTPKAPKYHAGDEIIRTMMANLTANNRDPALIEAKLHDNMIAAAKPAPVAKADSPLDAAK